MKKRERFTRTQIRTFDAFVDRVNKTNKIFRKTIAGQEEFNSLVQFMPKLSTATVLDVGCGTGRFVIPLARIAKKVVGIDLSTHSIALLRKQAKKERLINIQARVADVRTFRTKQTFDYILMVNVLHHVQDIDSLLTRVRPMLARNGRLVIYEFNPLNLLFIPAFILSGQLLVHMNKEYLRSLMWPLARCLKRAGYTLVSIHRHALLPMALYDVSPMFIKINTVATRTPILNNFCAFHIITCKI